MLLNKLLVLTLLKTLILIGTYVLSYIYANDGLCRYAPLKRELVCPLIASTPNKIVACCRHCLQFCFSVHWCKRRFLSILNCKRYCSVKCFNKTGYCPVHKVKDLSF